MTFFDVSRAIRLPDIVGSHAQGIDTGLKQGQAIRLRELAKTHGVGLSNMDPAALDAYAREDPTMVGDLRYRQGRDQTMDTRDQRNFDYRIGRDQVSDQRYNSEQDYRHGRDELSDQRYAEEQAYTRGRQAAADARIHEQDGYVREQRIAAGIFAQLDASPDPASVYAEVRKRAIAQDPDLANYLPEVYDPSRMAMARGVYGIDPPSQYQPQSPEGKLAADKAAGLVNQDTPGFKIPNEYMRDPNNPSGVIPIPGTKAARERQQAEVAFDGAYQSYERKSSIILDTVDGIIKRATDSSGEFGLPFDTEFGLAGALASFIPGTRAKDVSADLDTVRALIGFEELAEMRNNSPSGGALGQISNMENQLLQAVRGSLEQGQTKEQAVNNLLKVRNLTLAARKELTRLQGRPTDPAPYVLPPNVDPSNELSLDRWAESLNLQDGDKVRLHGSESVFTWESD